MQDYIVDIEIREWTAVKSMWFRKWVWLARARAQGRHTYTVARYSENHSALHRDIRSLTRVIIGIKLSGHYRDCGYGAVQREPISMVQHELYQFHHRGLEVP